MRYLVDTNLLVRLANPSDPSFPIASNAVYVLHNRGASLFVTAQNLIEFRSVGTRSQVTNGLGLSLAEVEAEAARFEMMFPLLEETPAIFPA